ncbi:SLBB domain-containing protein [Candidatus Poribacteria bacterium]
MLRHTRLYLTTLFVLVIVFGLPLSGSAAVTKDDTSDTDEYIIEPGDLINIVIAGYEEDYNRTIAVQPTGEVRYMSLEEIQAAGMTVPQLEEEIGKQLQIYISDPHVKVSVQREEYIIQLGDIIAISVDGHEDYSEVVVVQPDGKISYTLLEEELQAEALTTLQLEDEIKKGLESQISDAQVTITIEKKDAILEEVSEIEETPAEDLEMEPEDAEEPELEKREYLIRPGDIIDIVVMERDDYSRIVMVRPNGKIVHSALGEIPAAGFTEERLSQEIAARLSHQMSNPQVQAAVTGTVDFAKVETDEQHEYVIKPRDVVNIIVLGRNNYDQTMVVQPNGKVLYPPMGEIRATGLTSAQLTDNVVLELSTHINNPVVMVNVGQFIGNPDGIQKAEFAPPASLKKFGYDFFTGAKNRILKLEESLTEATGELPAPSAVRDAISGFVGPMDMMSANVTATVPAKYMLGPGDRLTLRLWTDVMEPQTIPLVVDNNGEIAVPKVGKIVARGMTLAQFQEAARQELTRVAYKDLKLIVTLDKLRSIQIFITGAAFRPGSYAVSAVTTLFNALYMCGGPNDDGSLRDIKLLRNNETKTVDFYKFLMDGESSQNFSLDSGDTILIPQVGQTVTISGEVKRPAIYELREDERLLELISFAGGIRPSGFLQRVQVDSVDAGRERIVIDADLSEPDLPNQAIFDGDTVTVFSILSERMNTVTLEGKVRMPGVYQLKEGMKVSDLIQAARGPLGEAYMERADLLRLNPDKKTTKLIPVNLSKALVGDGGNDIGLEQWDRLVVYSKWDVRWEADRVVSIHGAVQRPGSYERSDDMTIGDLLIQSGGVLPDAYLDRALLVRLGERGVATEAVPVNLKDSGQTLKLKDGDTLMVYTYQEIRWEPRREVTIAGAVQNPGSFPRLDNMKVSDLIQRAGGFLPEAYPERALLRRLNERQQVAQGFFISLVLALQDDPKNNLNLKDGDELTIYTYEEATWEPKREVTVEGAVLSPGVFERVDGMKVSDLLLRAGGLLPNSYLERADMSRFHPDHETYETIPVNLAGMLAGDKTADILLQDEDMLTVYTIKEAQYRPENIVTIHGMVQRPGEYARTIGMKLSDLLFASGGLIPGAYKSVEISRINDDGQSAVLVADIDALAEGDESQDAFLNDKDIVSIRKREDFLDDQRIVTLSGEMQYPGNYTLKRNERLSELIQRAGGTSERAYLEASVITRKIEYLVMNEQRRSVLQVGKLFDELSAEEYKRELARAKLIQQRNATSDEESDAASAKRAFTTGIGVPVVGSLEEAAQAAAAASIPGQTEAAISEIEEMTKSQYTMVTPARKITSFLPSGRLVVDLQDVMEHPGTKNDIILEDGDVINIPAIPATISVSGAVIQPASLVYVKGKSVRDYIEMAGGYSRDADEESVYVIKANGLVVSKDKARLSPGDMIVVPAKVIVQKVTDRWSQVISAVKFTVTTLATVYTIRLILKEI